MLSQAAGSSRGGCRHCGTAHLLSRVLALASSAAGCGPSPTSKRVVITGGSRGLGFAMAQEFLRLGDAVCLCGRDEQRLAAAVEALRQECGDDARVHGCRADCSSPEDMQQFGGFVQERLGGVDLWLNNQGEWVGAWRGVVAQPCF